jgi:hypothetical protein
MRRPSELASYDTGARRMCAVDAAAKEAAVARFLQEYPQARQVDREHPALRGCAEPAWTDLEEAKSSRGGWLVGART